MEFPGETNKLKLAQILLFCLRYGLPSGVNYTDEDIRKKMKLENEDDIYRLRSCIDLIEDTEDAIVEFCEHQLSRNRSEEPLGEMYLRLYGILNTIYLQMQAVVEIAEVVKMPNKKEINNKLGSHKAIAIRNMVGAHTVNYMHFESIENKRTNYFRITQVELRADASKLAIVGRGYHEEVNLRVVIFDFSNILETILLEIVNKYIKTLCKTDKYYRDLLQKSIDLIKASPTQYGSFDIGTRAER